jgi:RNA polymerase sigma-70 factor (ECF subfamily)
VQRLGNAVAVVADDEPASTSPENDLLGRETVAVVDRALAQLSEDRRAVLIPRLDHDLSYEEIAGLMNWPVSKVKSEIFRARQISSRLFEGNADRAKI